MDDGRRTAKQDLERFAEMVANNEITKYFLIAATDKETVLAVFNPDYQLIGLVELAKSRLILEARDRMVTSRFGDSEGAN